MTVQTIDITPAFAPEQMERIDKAQDALHDSVLVAANKLKEIVEMIREFPKARTIVAHGLQLSLVEDDPEAEGSEAGADLLKECEVVLDKWDDASRQFLRAVSGRF